MTIIQQQRRKLQPKDIFNQDCVLMEHRFDHRWDDVYCDYTTVQVWINPLAFLFWTNKVQTNRIVVEIYISAWHWIFSMLLYLSPGACLLWDRTTNIYRFEDRIVVKINIKRRIQLKRQILCMLQYVSPGACLLWDGTTQRLDSLLPWEQQLNLEPI